MEENNAEGAPEECWGAAVTSLNSVVRKGLFRDDHMYAQT